MDGWVDGCVCVYICHTSIGVGHWHMTQALYEIQIVITQVENKEGRFPNKCWLKSVDCV